MIFDSLKLIRKAEKPRSFCLGIFYWLVLEVCIFLIALQVVSGIMYAGEPPPPSTLIGLLPQQLMVFQTLRLQERI